MALDLLAALAATPASSVEGVVLQYGLLGALFLGLVWWANKQINAKDERIKRYEDNERRIQDIMVEQLIPALTKSEMILVEATAVLADWKRREGIAAAIDEAKRKAINAE